MRVLGFWILLAGVALGGYALLVFDPSVPVYGVGRVNNIGLMQDRQNMLIAACAVAVVGTLLVAFGGPSSVPNVQAARFQNAVDEADLTTMETMLVAGQIGPTSESEDGRGWLQYAARGALPQCKLLLDFGFDPNRKDTRGLTALEVAKTVRANDVLGELEKGPRATPRVAKHTAIDGDPVHPLEVHLRNASIPDQIAQLVSLRDLGSLTAAEFDTAKAKVLGLTAGENK
jgi:hypothetical protein